MSEVGRNLQEKFGVSAAAVQHRESEIRRHFPEAWVEGYEGLIPEMANPREGPSCPGGGRASGRERNRRL